MTTNHTLITMSNYPITKYNLVVGMAIILVRLQLTDVPNANRLIIHYKKLKLKVNGDDD